MSCSRRTLLQGIAASVAFAGSNRLAAAAPSKASVEQRRLANRLELWATFSQRNQSLVARYHSTRWSSLLESPLEVDGQLLFLAPDLLVLRDAGFSGSVTRIDGSRVSVRSTQSGSDDASRQRRIDTTGRSHPGLAWAADRLLRLFAPGPSDRVIEDARHEVPRGRTPRLTLRPPREHLGRLEVRDLTVSFDPVGGAPLRIEIAQSQGDRHRLDFADHRQGMSEDEVRRLIERG